MIYYTMAYDKSFSKKNPTIDIGTGKYKAKTHSASSLLDIFSYIAPNELNGHVLISAYHKQKVDIASSYTIVSKKLQGRPAYKEFPTRTNASMSISAEALFIVDIDYLLDLPHNNPAEYREQILLTLRSYGITCDLIIRPSSSYSNSDNYHKLHILGVLAQAGKTELKQLNTTLNKLFVQDGLAKGAVNARGSIAVEAIDHATASPIQMIFLGHKNEDVFKPIFDKGTTTTQLLSTIAKPSEAEYNKQKTLIRESLEKEASEVKIAMVNALALRENITMEEAQKQVDAQEEGEELVSLTTIFDVEGIGTITTLDILWDKFTRENKYDNKYVKWTFTKGSTGYKARLNYYSDGLFDIYTFHFNHMRFEINLSIKDTNDAMDEMAKKASEYVMANHSGKSKAEFPIYVLNLAGVDREDMDIIKGRIKDETKMPISTINGYIKKYSKRKAKVHVSDDMIGKFHVPLGEDQLLDLPHVKTTPAGVIAKTTAENLERILEVYGLSINKDAITGDVVIPQFLDGNVYLTDAISRSRAQLENLLNMNDISTSSSKISASIETLLHNNPNTEVNYVTQLFESTQYNKDRDYVGELLAKIDIRENTPYTRKRFERVMRLWFTQCVAAADAAIRTPNKEAMAKFEMMPLFTGGQGVRKSAFKYDITPAILYRYIGEKNNLDTTDKDVLQEIKNYWLLEVSEANSSLNGSRHSMEVFKAFQSKSIIEFRAPYDRTPKRTKRRQCLIGTDNNTTSILKDRTGNRRTPTFEILSLGNLNELTEEFKAELWAQVFYSYLSGARWWMTHEEEAEQEYENEYFISEDVFMAAVSTVISGLAVGIYSAEIQDKGYFHTNASEIASNLDINITKGANAQGVVTKIGSIMRKLNYEVEKYGANKTRYKITRERAKAYTNNLEL